MLSQVIFKEKCPYSAGRRKVRLETLVNYGHPAWESHAFAKRVGRRACLRDTAGVGSTRASRGSRGMRR